MELTFIKRKLQKTPQLIFCSEYRDWNECAVVNSWSLGSGTLVMEFVFVSLQGVPLKNETFFDF